MFVVAYLTAAGVIGLGAMAKVRTLHRMPAHVRPPALVAITWCVLLLAATFALIPAGEYVDTVHGLEGLTSTIWHITCIAAAYLLERFVLFTGTTPEQARRRDWPRRIVFVAAAATMLLAWLAASPEDARHGMRVVDTSLATAAWQGAFLLALGWALGDGAVLSWRKSWQAQPSSLRTSLRLLGTGAAAGLAFCLCKLWTAAVQIIGAGPIVPGPILIALVLACGLGSTVGVVYPSVAWHGYQWARWCGRWRRHRRLYRLWSDLAAHEDLAVWNYGRRPATAWQDARWLRWMVWRHYRRVLEISDFVHTLRAWVPHGTAETGLAEAQRRRLRTRDHVAFAHAYMIVAGLAVLNSGAAADPATCDPGCPEPTHDDIATLDGAASFKCRVAYYYQLLTDPADAAAATSGPSSPAPR